MTVGLTGGIGSGKSTVAKIFSSLHIPYYDADSSSKNLIDKNKDLQLRLQMILGNDVITENGSVDRVVMADLIFNDQKLLKQANAFIHPAVGQHFKSWKEAQISPYILKEAAILFESGSYKECDQVIVVSAPDELRISRVALRSGLTRSEIEARMAKQWPQEKKISLADFHIINDGSSSLIEQVVFIHKKLMALAK